MKCVLIKTEKGIRGATTDDHDAWSKFKRRLETMKPGTWMRCEFTRMRNGRHHRKFMALLNLVKENSETYDTIEKALIAVKLCIGHFDLLADPLTGEITKHVKSIAYESMDQDTFDVWYEAAVNAVLQHILPTMDHDTAEKLLDMIHEGWVVN